ncbi:hypothetical protein PQD13_gp29 [Gordonia phage Clawz]|uniref:Uncharacterized protein n=1 Tax=Gordonia phage Clawz TaxID=2743910 RepID=A0AAE7F8A5_9CAUD|nr:hypothetical protein PQD13_gp29 [Gordonia phage Clawz]QKY79941.1 hypothetical protein SEA_CLAWZ_29 [Gordonia phage Clawz]
MFQGSIPADLRSIVREHYRAWQGDQLWVACSGNFTIERVVNSLTPPAVHSNDVTVYSCAVGEWLTSRQVHHELNEEHLDKTGWLEPFMQTGTDKLATIMLCTRFLQFMEKNGMYYQRMMAGYRDQFAEMHAATVAKLDAIEMRLTDFHPIDAREYVDLIPADAAVMSFPPFWGGGYEKMWELLDKYFVWNAPTYEVMDIPGVMDLCAKIMDREHWVLGVHEDVEEFRPYLRGRVQTALRGFPINVYSSGTQSRIVVPRTKTEAIPMPKITRTDEIRADSHIALHPLTQGQFAGIRSQFLSKGIKPGSPLLACAVSIDGRVIGAFAFLPPKFDPDDVYLMSDFPVSWSQYKHLAKLIVVAAMSDETRQLLQRQLSSLVSKVSTTAFTNNPVSMKYRGLLKLHSRKDADDGVHDYQLQYSAPIGEWTLQEGLEMWSKKWSKTK